MGIDKGEIRIVSFVSRCNRVVVEEVITSKNKNANSTRYKKKNKIDETKKKK
jgi:hypothetical protein